MEIFVVLVVLVFDLGSEVVADVANLADVVLHHQGNLECKENKQYGEYVVLAQGASGTVQLSIYLSSLVLCYPVYRAFHK